MDRFIEWRFLITVKDQRSTSKEPPRVMDEYRRHLHNTETVMTCEDREVSEHTNNNALQTNVPGLLREMTTDLAVDSAELDMEVAEILNTNPEPKIGYCQSPKEPWVPQANGDITSADNRNLDINNSFTQQISPIIISPSPSNSKSNQTMPITTSEGNSNFIQHISPVINSLSPGHSPAYQSDLKILSETFRRSSTSSGDPEQNEVYPSPIAYLTEQVNAVLHSEADLPGKERPSTEELRCMVLDRSADRPGLDRFTQTEEEQFAEILEDFLEENKGLPPEIRENILDKLTKTRETVAEQKEDILYTAEIYNGESEDQPNMDEFDKAADDEVMKLISEIELPDLSTPVISKSPNFFYWMWTQTCVSPW